MNPFNAYARNQTDSRSSGDHIVALFEKAADHMCAAKMAITQSDVQARYESSQKAMLIMEGLLACLNRDTPERAKAAESLETYYKAMIMMISRVNIFDDEETCRSIEESFRDMARFWKKVTVELAAQENQPTESSSASANFIA